jgi:hypothetical protein
MSIECHFLLHTFHYVSVNFVLNSTSLTCCPSLHTRSSTLLAVFPLLSSPCFWYRWNFLPNWDLVVYTFALRYPQRKWSQAERLGERAGHGSSPRSDISSPQASPERPPWMLSLYGQLHHLAGTIWSTTQFQDDSVLVTGSSVTFQHN